MSFLSWPALIISLLKIHNNIIWEFPSIFVFVFFWALESLLCTSRARLHIIRKSARVSVIDSVTSAPSTHLGYQEHRCSWLPAICSLVSSASKFFITHLSSMLLSGWCSSLVLDLAMVAVALLVRVFLFSSRPSQTTKDLISLHEDHSWLQTMSALPWKNSTETTRAVSWNLRPKATRKRNMKIL